MAIPRRPVEGSFAILIRLVDINARCSQQQLDAFRSAFIRSHVEGSFETIIIHRVDISSCGNQQLQCFRVITVVKNSLIIIRNPHGFELILGIFF